jgi:glycine/D-amino acid oxidase-like deaminating enzyme
MDRLPDSPLSCWLDLYGDYQPEPSLEGDLTVDIAVVGGGFTGLTTAYELLRVEPSLKVAVLEAKTAGYGASGRNGSFGMTVIGLGFSYTAFLKGKAFLKDAYTYMVRAVEAMDELIQREKLDCQRIRPGFLRVATTPAYIRRLQSEVELMESLGISDFTWLSAEETRSRVNSETYLGAMWEPRLLLVDPARLVRAEKRLAQREGAQVYENSPVLEIEGRSPYKLKTPAGQVTAGKVVFAVNAYSHRFVPLRRKQVPAFTYVIATEPLSYEALDSIGWDEYEGVEDARNLIHYYRLTQDQRIMMGGGPIGLTWNGNLDADSNPAAWAHLEQHIYTLFPQLKGVKITHRWGGPISVTTNLFPAIGSLNGGSLVYSLGCIGHGVSASHLNAQVMRDLALERKTDLVDSPFVNKPHLPWPSEPVQSAVAISLRGLLELEDRYHERIPKGFFPYQKTLLE